MPFEPILDWLVQPGPDETDPGPLPPIGPLPAAFSDDVVIDGARVALRIILADDGAGGYRVDASESDGRPEGGATAGQSLVAATLGLAMALGRPATTGLMRRIELATGGACGGSGPGAPDVAAFVVARIVDTVLGALQRVWPDRVGAGSCSLGALVQLNAPGGSVIDLVPGGEGGTPERTGAAGWSSPVLRAPEVPDLAEITVVREPRPGSGGMGARNGGDGVRVSYTVSQPTVAHVRTDRVSNPPHGIDRAGPPSGSAVTLRHGSQARRLEPWCTVELPPGSTLVVETCGGAGHGFPGYGDIEFDASEWFGSPDKQN